MIKEVDKVKRRAYLLFNVVFIIILLVGCNNTKSLQETFKSKHAHTDIVKVLKFHDDNIVLYTSNKDSKISSAEYSQVNNKWKMSNDISVDNAGELSFGFTHKGQKNEVLFGKINDQSIKKVQLKKENGKFLNATIVNKNGRSYWYMVWTYGKAILIGLNKNDHIIYKASFS